MFLYLMELPRTRIFVLVILTAIFALLFPSVRLNSKIIARRERIKMDLPNAIDLLVVSVEAGLAFDMAVEKVIEKISGPLAQEFVYTLNEIRMGKSRGDAFRELVRIGMNWPPYRSSDTGRPAWVSEAAFEDPVRYYPEGEDNIEEVSMKAD